MTTTPEAHAAALATELAYLVDLPAEQRGPSESARYDEVRWALADADPAGRMSAYAAAVAAIDPDRVLGPYPDFATELTVELYAFEEWRLGRFYYGNGPESDVARRLLCVSEQLFYTWPPEQTFDYSEVQLLLGLGRVDAGNFPGFCLDDYIRESGVSAAARERERAAYAAVARSLMGESPDV